MVIGHLVPSLRVWVELPGLFTYVGAASCADLTQVPGHKTGGSIIHLIIQLLHRQIIHPHIGLHGILGTHRLAPQLTDKIDTMTITPVIVNKITGIALPLMTDMTVCIIRIDIEIIRFEHFCRIRLERLPLCRLLPETIAAIAAVTVAETT